MKRSMIYMCIFAALAFSTWSAGEALFSFVSAAKLTDPFWPAQDRINMQLFILNLGLAVVFMKELAERLDCIFSMENYMLTRLGRICFWKKCISYISKGLMYLCVLKTATDIIISLPDMKDHIRSLAFLEISCIMTLGIWELTAMALRMLHMTQKKAMAVMLFLVMICAFFSENRVIAAAALTYRSVDDPSDTLLRGKMPLILLLVIINSLLLKRYESTGTEK